MDSAGSGARSGRIGPPDLGGREPPDDPGTGPAGRARRTTQPRTSTAMCRTSADSDSGGSDSGGSDGADDEDAEHDAVGFGRMPLAGRLRARGPGGAICRSAARIAAAACPPRPGTGGEDPRPVHDHRLGGAACSRSRPSWCSRSRWRLRPGCRTRHCAPCSALTPIIRSPPTPYGRSSPGPGGGSGLASDGQEYIIHAGNGQYVLHPEAVAGLDAVPRAGRRAATPTTCARPLADRRPAVHRQLLLVDRHPADRDCPGRARRRGRDAGRVRAGRRFCPRGRRAPPGPG